MPIENKISICQCKTCQSTLFEAIDASMIQQNENGTYTPVVTTMIYRCLSCGTVVKPYRVTGDGQQKSVKRSIYAELPEDKTAEPGTKRVDLAEITGTKKKLLRVPGGLSGMSTGFPSSK